MNGNSKREKVSGFIRRAVRDAIVELSFEIHNEQHRAVLKDYLSPLQCKAANYATETYRFKELQDIMAWKKPKGEE